MKHFTLTICSSAILLFSCTDSDKTTTEATTDSAKMTEQTATTEVATTPKPRPDSATMMKNWQAYMTPGDIHKMIASWDGTWQGDVTMWHDSKTPPEKSTATTTNKMVMGGRYQVSTTKGNMMGMPFEGMGTLAYDNARKVFMSSWMDNMGTGLMYMEGTWDDGSKTITFKGKSTDPSSGSADQMDVRQTFKVVDDKTQVMEMFGPGPDGNDMKWMEIKFTRK